MVTSVVIGFTKFVGFVLVVASAITTFYAAIHAININSQIDVFFAGLLALLIGVVTGPLYGVISVYGLTHYLAYTALGAILVTIPIMLAWCYMAYNLASGYLRG